MEAILDQNVLDSTNFCTLDCSVFTDRKEFLKSVGFARTNCRLESKNLQIIVKKSMPTNGKELLRVTRWIPESITITDYLMFFRELIIDYLKKNKFTIGGEHKVVEID